MIPPKSWAEINTEDLGSERLQFFKRKRFLVPEKVSQVISEAKVVEPPRPVSLEPPEQESAPVITEELTATGGTE